MKHKILIFVLAIILLATPSLIFAQSINIPCDGVKVPCDFPMFIKLVSNVLSFLVLLSIPLATIAFAWSGFLMLTAAGSESQVEKAKGIFTKVLIGFVFVLAAWLIVRTITNALLNSDNYEDLLQSALPSVMQEHERVVGNIV